MKYWRLRAIVDSVTKRINYTVGKFVILVFWYFDYFFASNYNKTTLLSLTHKHFLTNWLFWSITNNGNAEQKLVRCCCLLFWFANMIFVDLKFVRSVNLIIFTYQKKIKGNSKESLLICRCTPNKSQEKSLKRILC